MYKSTKSASADEGCPTISFKDIQIGDRIGSGLFGNIYKGTWNDVSVATKLLTDDIKDEDKLEFTQEVELHKQLMSPRIVKLYGICDELRCYGLVMEYMEKGSLWDVIAQDPEGVFDWEHGKSYQILWEMALGCQYLHERDIIHRDIKSLNVLLDNEYHAKLTDFGFALQIEPQPSEPVVPKGTFQWLAPEIALGQDLTKAVDIYSLAVVFWEVASKEIPWAGYEEQTILFNVVTLELRQQIPEDTPEVVRNVIRRGWFADPKQRPEIAEVEATLRAALK